MEERLLRVDGIALSDPVAYQSVEDVAEAYLVKLELNAPLQVGDEELTEIFLHLGETTRDVSCGDRLAVTGYLVQRRVITRSGKLRQNGVYQLLVQDVER